MICQYRHSVPWQVFRTTHGEITHILGEQQIELQVSAIQVIESPVVNITEQAFVLQPLDMKFVQIRGVPGLRWPNTSRRRLRRRIGELDKPAQLESW